LMLMLATEEVSSNFVRKAIFPDFFQKRSDNSCHCRYYKMWDVRCSHTRDAFICEHIEPVLTTTSMSLPIFGSCKHTGCDYAENAKDFSELTGICMVGATNSSHLSACNATGKVPATYTDLRAAQKLGAQKCRCGKTSDNRLVHPMWEPTEGCGDRKGLIACADNATSPSTGFWCKSAECPEINIDYTDFTFSAQAASSWQVCSHMCRGKRRCHAWTWNYVSGSCALKVGDFGRRRLPDRISGLRYCGTAGVVECADELNTSALVVGVASFSLLVLLLLLLVVFICKKRAKKNPNVTRRNKDKATDNIYTVNTGTHAFGVRQRDVGHHNTVELYECEEIEISCHANRKRKVSDIVQHLEDETVSGHPKQLVKANTSSEVSTGKSDADLPYNKTLVKRKI